MTTKIALITGGSRGLGKNTALSLAKRGVDLVITYRSQAEAAQQVVNEAKSLGVKAVALCLDLSQHENFTDFVAQLKNILQHTWQRDNFDYLLNNAGEGLHLAFSEITEMQFDTLVNVHLKGVFFLTQKLLPLIADHGRIINISSGLTRFTVPGYSAYAAMKAAIEVLSKYLAKELGERGISVNVVAPGAIETDFGGARLRNDNDLKQYLASQTALGRVGVADDIGGMIASLFSDDNRWVNGQRIEASGGMFL